MDSSDRDSWLSLIHFLLSSAHYSLSVSFTFHSCPRASLLPGSRLGAALSGPPVSELGRRDYRGIRVQSWRRAPVDGEMKTLQRQKMVLGFMWHHCRNIHPVKPILSVTELRLVGLYLHFLLYKVLQYR